MEIHTIAFKNVHTHSHIQSKILFNENITGTVNVSHKYAVLTRDTHYYLTHQFLPLQSYQESMQNWAVLSFLCLQTQRRVCKQTRSHFRNPFQTFALQKLKWNCFRFRRSPIQCNFRNFLGTHCCSWFKIHRDRVQAYSGTFWPCSLQFHTYPVS